MISCQRGLERKLFSFGHGRSLRQSATVEPGEVETTRIREVLGLYMP